MMVHATLDLATRTSKNALCPSMEPSRNKSYITDCDGEVNRLSSEPAARRTAAGSSYLPGMCWDEDSHSTQQQQQQQQQRDNGKSKVAVTADSSSPLGVAVAAVAAASASARKAQPDDCGAHDPYPLQLLAGGPGSVGIAAVAETQLEAESQMQACQAADQGPPANPIVLPLYWTAGRVCRSGGCTGGSYTAELVQEQVDYVNRLYAHVGIQFKWDGVMHYANASSPNDIDVCLDPSGRCWICKQQRFGDQAAINVVTAPTHLGGTSLGVTLYPSYMTTGAMPGCANWVFLYEKTLPGLGGRSLIDGGLSDSGATLAHEIGHQLMLHHTWYEERRFGGKPSLQEQCEMSASTHPADIIAGRSDGVRDTPAQSLNGTRNSVTDILRFVDCNLQTGAYSNTTAYAQQSCSAAVGFPQGSNYFNNFNNLMSYGDKTCLRTLTAGQGARARCAIKCMRRMQC
ncbi:hypothetical protein OEZ85_002931 [Tetradesmus obliquus]|uniref:Peptidase M43 pregnancy-associated plasma-A domain-containing protein n=1 Tax=Tetradesmus obliquus TaxID=3088 RepID=A0ABY8TZJ3_TETOB|nr:hypothetical protein OEZ85_002931 [Tetradesmus obliquus]